ncbi:MAG: DUF488 domain-containing protein [Thermodesulfobacteriota bacterium]
MNSNAKKQIFSIGHSNRALDEFLGILKRYGIEALADIRSYPRSRRNPHFDREVLEKELPAHGIEYVWINELGGLKEWGYEGYMGTPGFEYGLNTLEALASGKSTAFMCAELDWRRCHRSFISHALHLRGWDVVHIYDAKESETHSGLF